MTEQEEEKLFEAEVRRIARELWPDAQYEGALMVEGRERDGIFETDECVHLVECTVSRRRDKANDDAKKLVNLENKYRPKHPNKAVKSWFITRDEPTADQRTVIKEKYKSVTALSFSQFQSKLIDVNLYLTLRMNYAFGSVRDPANRNSPQKLEYVPLDLVEATTSKVWSVAEIQKSLTEGNRFVILGDYGSGKSMTLREMFRGLRAEYLKDRTSTFPLYLNLRDHFGQTNPAEVLERHARNIGFPHPSHLVRAWRAGYVILLIDGFDELATLGIQGLWKRLQDVRFRAMAAVRQFIKEQPPTAGIVLAGRAHFFDSAKERRNALYPTSDFIEFALNEFNDEQIQRYLSKQGLAGNVPDWIPSRPLLVGYLAASGVLKEAIAELSSDSDDVASDPAQGWDYIVDRVCDRESEIDIGIDGPTVRRMLERLATIARQSQSGLGPLSPENITAAFTDVCGYQPDEKGSLLLQRLPGLGIDRDDEGTRIFLDEDFADVCRAGDVVAHICDPFGSTLEQFRGADRSIGSLGVGVVLLKTSSMSLNSGKMQPAIQQALTNDELSSVVLDLVRVSMESKLGIGIPIRLSGVLVHSLELSVDAGNLSMLTFSECLFSYLAIDAEVDSASLPRFRGCYVDEVDGRSSSKDLPEGVFDNECEFGHFAEAPETTRAIVAMDLPVGARVLLTVLKKLYERKGSGRKENALHRGLDHHSRRFVSSVLRLLQTEGIVSSYKRGGMDMNIWIPDRSKMTRVQKLLASPRTCGDILIQRASDLN